MRVRVRLKVSRCQKNAQQLHTPCTCLPSPGSHVQPETSESQSGSASMARLSWSELLSQLSAYPSPIQYSLISLAVGLSALLFQFPLSLSLSLHNPPPPSVPPPSRPQLPPPPPPSLPPPLPPSLFPIPLSVPSPSLRPVQHLRHGFLETGVNNVLLRRTWVHPPGQQRTTAGLGTTCEPVHMSTRDSCALTCSRLKIKSRGPSFRGSQEPETQCKGNGKLGGCAGWSKQGGERNVVRSRH